MYNNYREQNEHIISQNIGQSYTCYKRVTLADLMTTSDSTLSNQIKVHPKTIREIEDEMWDCFDNVRNSQSGRDYNGMV